MIQIPQLTTPCQDIPTIRSDLYIHGKYKYWDITTILLQEYATCVLFRNPNCRTEKIKLYSREPKILFPMCKEMPWFRHLGTCLAPQRPRVHPAQPTWDCSGHSGNRTIFSFLYHQLILHTHSLMCHQNYIITASESVIKKHTSTEMLLCLSKFKFLLCNFTKYQRGQKYRYTSPHHPLHNIHAP